jgi:raffinose/stachyose/melibiose transport system permease protein
MEIWQWSGFNMIIFLSGMKSIPADYYESAKIDGATRWQEIRYIMIPLMVQSFTITFIFSLISGLKVFAQVYGTTNGGPADSTQVMATFLYRSFSHGHYGYSAAVGFVFMILISTLSLAAFGAIRKKEVEY